MNLPISAPRVNGVSLRITMELVGLLPGNTLCGRILSSSAPDMPDFSSSARASADVFPFVKASVCARKLASKI
jgi:hypothetical protein